MRRLQPGRDGALDLRPHLGLRRLRHDVPAQARHVRPEIAVAVDQAGGAAHGRDRRPAAGAPLAGERKVHADVVSVAFARVGQLAEPASGNHDRAAGGQATRGQLEKGLVRAVRSAEVVDVRDDRPTLHSACPRWRGGA